MSDKQIQSLIVTDKDIRFGKPTLKGTRLTVADVLNYLSAGDSYASLILNFPGLTEKKIRAAIGYAANTFRTAM
jgi:uncharacterized protein (DUF433 family)